MGLAELGWNEFFESAWRSIKSTGLVPARVVSEHRAGYVVWTEEAERPAEMSGRLRHLTATPGHKPVVGDWVALRASGFEKKGIIHELLPRRTCLSRTTSGRLTDKQIMASNVDRVFIVASLSAELNLRRIERYLLVAWQSGAQPSLVLTKKDLCTDVEDAVARVMPAAADLTIHTVCGLTGEGLAGLDNLLHAGQTAALLGPSGVGKSTMINRWCGEARLEVQPVRETDQKGRHTTTRRQLLRLPSGALVIDTPGMREVQLWEGEKGIQEAFAEIEQLATQCRFSNCQHNQEPGCAVRSAIREGELSEERLKSHRKLQRETQEFEEKASKRAQARTRKQIKAMTRQFNDGQKKGDS